MEPPVLQTNKKTSGGSPLPANEISRSLARFLRPPTQFDSHLPFWSHVPTGLHLTAPIKCTHSIHPDYALLTF